MSKDTISPRASDNSIPYDSYRKISDETTIGALKFQALQEINSRLTGENYKYEFTKDVHEYKKNHLNWTEDKQEAEHKKL